MHKVAGKAFTQRLRSWFPDREFFMRSQGQVRFIRISSRVQMIAAALAVGLLLFWLVSISAMAVKTYVASRDQAVLLEREAQVASAEGRVATYRKDLKGVADDLSRRQDFLEQMVGTLPDDIKVGETVSDSKGEAAKTVDKVSMGIPEAAPLARLEARQLAFVEGLTRLADRRAAQAAEAIRKLGLSPGAMLATVEDRSAMGGPLLSLATSTDGRLDPRFARLGASLSRMQALERGLYGIPNVLPAAAENISSGFGYRSDPFTHGGAFHAGLDFKGPRGSGIFAAARGRVSFVGQRQGYGNCVEIDHGNGLVTRYAHMSAFRTTVGTKVRGGDVIGLIGNTGRSTGPHLHFEVRINDRAVNPRPFLEAAPSVLEEARSRAAALRGQ